MGFFSDMTTRMGNVGCFFDVVVPMYVFVFETGGEGRGGGYACEIKMPR